MNAVSLIESMKRPANKGSQIVPPARDAGTANQDIASPRGDAFFDAPNLTSMFYHSNGGRPDAAVSAIDLSMLRSCLSARFGVRRFSYVVAANAHRNRSARRQFVERFHWKFIEARRASPLNRDPVDTFIIERILAATSQLTLTGPRTIVLISHDGDFTEACRGFLHGGGRVVLTGFTERFSRRLYDLSNHPRCDLIDLRYDLNVADR